MQQTSAELAAVIQTGRSIVTGGFVISAVLFFLVILLLVLFYARALASRTRHPRDDVDGINFDRSEVIGRFPPRQVSETDVMGVVHALGESGTEIGHAGSRRPRTKLT